MGAPGTPLTIITHYCTKVFKEGPLIGPPWCRETLESWTADATFSNMEARTKTRSNFVWLIFHLSRIIETELRYPLRVLLYTLPKKIFRLYWHKFVIMHHGFEFILFQWNFLKTSDRTEEAFCQNKNNLLNILSCWVLEDAGLGLCNRYLSNIYPWQNSGRNV